MNDNVNPIEPIDVGNILQNQTQNKTISPTIQVASQQKVDAGDAWAARLNNNLNKAEILDHTHVIGMSDEVEIKKMREVLVKKETEMYREKTFDGIIMGGLIVISLFILFILFKKIKKSMT